MSGAVTFNPEYAPKGAELGDWVYIDGSNGEELWVLREVEVGPDPSIEGAQFSGKTYQWVNETDKWEWDPGKGDNYIFNGFGKKNLTTQYNTNKYVATNELGKSSSVKGKIYISGQTESSKGSLRWPFDQIDEDTDYVFFRFGQYRPPLGRDARSGAKNAYEQYKYSSNLETIEEVGPIMLPMPQDISNTLEQNWQGKQFSRVGMAALTSLATGNFSDMNKMMTGGGNWSAIQGSLIAAGLNQIPGVGGNLTMSDVTGSTEGVVLNPNMEMLYDSPDIREVSMKYKLVPHNKEEAIAIQKIIRQFRFAALPSWGDGEDLELEGVSEGLKKFSVTGSEDFNAEDSEPIAENFIRVPWLCHFEFRTGGVVNPYVAQYKPCAITRVSINYTPDGTYASYLEGGPSAYEIDLSFIETKLIFKQDLAGGNY